MATPEPMSPLAAQASLGPAASAPHEDAALERAPCDSSATGPSFDEGGAVFMPPNSEWLAVEPLEEGDFHRWPKWLHSVFPDHNDAAVSMTSRPPSPTAPSMLPESVAAIVEPIVEAAPTPDEPTPPEPTATAPSCSASNNKGEKRHRPKQLTQELRSWMERRRKPYATLEEKTAIAAVLSISIPQVTNFCNNFRKRYFKVGKKLTSYRELVSTR
ncbi:hypothetical protein T484DRAFT_1903895 [Baffinella frigidus]|nr:hypothetical protein T484DRAFT_1903895 [Cryptophyta sp. CCMP2293]